MQAGFGTTERKHMYKNSIDRFDANYTTHSWSCPLCSVPATVSGFEQETCGQRATIGDALLMFPYVDVLHMLILRCMSWDLNQTFVLSKMSSWYNW
jgi:hypothetical protein